MFLEIAKPLVERGFSVIPIEPRGKKPMPGWGAMRRTRDLAVVEGWARQYPDSNVGICADENIVILETDNYEGLARIVGLATGKHALPETLMACGSSPNRPHLFYRATEKSKNVGNLAVPGLFECRFSNQYVVGAGSVHPNGSRYCWLNQAQVVEIPDWLVSALVRLAMSQKADSRNKPTIERVGERVPEGSRHYFLMQEGGRLWDGDITEDEFLERMRELNEKYCEPPKTEEHVLQCVRDIMRRTPYDPGPKVLIGGAPPGEAPSDPTDPPEEDWAALSADDLLAKDIPPRKPVMVEGEATLFYENSVNQILAWRGVGKTNFALGLASAIASGRSILDFKAPKPRRVLYLDGELPIAQLQERVRSFVPKELRHNFQLFSPEMITPPRGINLVSQKDFDRLLRLIAKHQTEVLFLDSQATLMVGDSTDDTFQEARMAVLRQLRWAGLCIIETHHVGKQGLQRGLSKNDDILDVQMMLAKSKDWEPEDGLEFELKYEKVRHAAHLDSNYKVRLVEGEWVKGASDEVAAAADLYLKDKSVRDVAKALKCSVSKAHKLRKKALDAKLIDAAIVLKSDK